jgi:predicted aspartyl protease
MIQGWFGDEGALMFEIDLIADDGLELPTEVMLDTGFSGWLAINEQDLQGLDWVYTITRSQQTAGGELDFDIYAVDILPSLKAWGFWGQTAIAGRASLTSPNPMVDAPTI